MAAHRIGRLNVRLGLGSTGAGALHENDPDHPDAARFGDRRNILCLASPHAFRWRRNRAAATNPAYFSNQDGSLEVIYGGGGLALYATIVDARNSEGAPEVCHYHSVGVMNTPALPYDADRTVTGPHPSAPVTIIFQQPGGNDSVNVTCYNTGNSAAYSPVVY
ncbi:MAG: hypothetical protein WBZ15_13980 [Mycobacterium sp.]